MLQNLLRHWKREGGCFVQADHSATHFGQCHMAFRTICVPHSIYGHVSFTVPPVSLLVLAHAVAVLAWSASFWGPPGA